MAFTCSYKLPGPTINKMKDFFNLKKTCTLYMVLMNLVFWLSEWQITNQNDVLVKANFNISKWHLMIESKRVCRDVHLSVNQRFDIFYVTGRQTCYHKTVCFHSNPCRLLRTHASPVQISYTRHRRCNIPSCCPLIGRYCHRMEL